MGTLTHAHNDPEIVSYLEPDASATILTFCVADDGRLYLRRNVSAGTNWTDLGIIPSGSPATGTPAGVTYIDQGGRQIRVFFRSEDGHLNVAWLQGNQWLMEELGNRVAPRLPFCAVFPFFPPQWVRCE